MVLVVVLTVVLSEGAPTSSSSSSPCPDAYMVPLTLSGGDTDSRSSSTSTCIDVFEAVVEFSKDDNVTWELHDYNRPLDDLKPRGWPYRARSGRGELRPQAYISQEQAAMACRNAAVGNASSSSYARKRLCTLNEYMQGCGGPQQYVYPYGDTYQEDYCNTGNPNPVLELFGPHATFNWTEMNDPRLDMLPKTLAVSGSFKRCTNPDVGTFDMSGNLDEWIGTIDASTGHGIFKGGYFVDSHINGNGCHYMTVAHATWYHDYSLGFRCCSGPEL
jgi:sulfatase modifying factor 1